MSKTDDLNYDEPWAMFKDEEEPWKDLNRLLDWEERLDTQMELGDAFGCSPSTISYWLDKARDEVEPEYDDEERQCEYFSVCGNLMDHPSSGVCTVCLDLMRHNDTADEIQVDGSVEDHMEELHDHYDGKVEEFQTAYDERQDDGEDSEDES